jgi:Ca2+-binding EF-hand superfamily protein
MIAALAAEPFQEPASVEIGNDAARQLIFLAENRPIFVRLRVTSQGRPFESLWIDSLRILHATLDRNGDGKLTTKEADQKAIAALMRLATNSAVAPTRIELDVDPKDGIVSMKELTEAVRPILGPFQLQFGRQALGRTDALFDYLDRDKDGQLTRDELAAIAGSLRPLDLDDDETISADELEPFNNPALSSLMEETSQRRARYAALPLVFERVEGESSLRVARLLLKKYDKANADVPGRLDNKLSPAEFGIDAEAFNRADANGDDALNSEELREFLSRMPIDLTLDVMLPPQASGRATIQVGGGGVLPKGTQVRQLGDGDVEIAIGQVRLDVHVDHRNTAAEEARRFVSQRFKAADKNKDGYLEGKEWTMMNAPQSPLAGLLEIVDRDGDGKIYLKELVEFAERQTEAARGRLVLTTADQGRAVFGILDLDRDRRLGAREVMRTVDRVMSWDGDGDGRVSPDEIPYHFHVTIARGELAGLTSEVAGSPMRRSRVETQPPGRADSPDWFPKMDRNHDGDISHREFLGPRDQFDRLDRDHDGLIDPDEARAALAAKTKGAPRDGSKP